MIPPRAGTRRGSRHHPIDKSRVSPGASDGGGRFTYLGDAFRKEMWHKPLPSPAPSLHSDLHHKSPSIILDIGPTTFEDLNDGHAEPDPKE